MRLIVHPFFTPDLNFDGHRNSRNNLALYATGDSRTKHAATLGKVLQGMREALA